MFKLIRVFPNHDSPYVGGYVDFDRQYTVGEFIQETLEKYPAIRGITNILYKSNFKVIPPTNNFFYVIIVFVYFLLFLLFCILYQPLLVKA